MAGVTRIRGLQTTAGASFDSKDENNLATDREVEERIKKHSYMFHNNGNGKTEFEFDEDNNITSIKIFDNENNIKQESTFLFESGILTKIVKEIFDENQISYSKIQKDFVYNNGNIQLVTNILV